VTLSRSVPQSLDGKRMNVKDNRREQ